MLGVLGEARDGEEHLDEGLDGALEVREVRAFAVEAELGVGGVEAAGVGRGLGEVGGEGRGEGEVGRRRGDGRAAARELRVGGGDDLGEEERRDLGGTRVNRRRFNVSGRKKKTLTRRDRSER